MPPKKRLGKAKKQQISQKNLHSQSLQNTKTIYLERPKEPVIHSLINPNKPTLICKECPKKFKFEESFNKHIREAHSKLRNSVKCADCPVRCPNKKILAEHILKTHNKTLYACPHCEKTFARSAHVSRHLRQGCQPDCAESYACEICDTSFTRKDNLMVHLRLHIQSKDYVCKQCPFTCMSFNRLCSHMQKYHSENRFECDICGKETGSRPSIIKHMEIHGEKKYACGVCSYSTHTIEVMRRHVLRHSDEKPFKCELCPRSFIQIQQLRVHLEKHINNPCDLCDKKFKTRAKLFAHKRTHDGGIPLVCPYDDCANSKREFAYEINFKEHLQSHVEKSFKCEVCNKSYLSETYLKRHMVTHTLERPRRCMYCMSARAYIRGEMLVRHVRTRHPAIFREHLAHVRTVMQTDHTPDSSDVRVRKSELESILNLLDAVADRIIEQNVGENVLYGGMQHSMDTQAAAADTSPTLAKKQGSTSTLLSEEELVESLNKLITQLIDAQVLHELGWPGESVDVILEKVLEQCGQKPADRARWSLVQRLRENAKHLFLHVIEDKVTVRMLSTHTIDQVIQHILRVSGDEHSATD